MTDIERRRREASCVITAKRLDSGYWLVRGVGPCNFSQPPVWPCDEDMLRAHSHPEASYSFIQQAVAIAIAQQLLRREGASREKKKP